MQLMMLGFLGVKKFPYTPIILPLPVVTIAFQLTMDALFDRPLSLLSLRAAHDLDLWDLAVQREVISEEISGTPATDLYVNPALSVTKGLDQLLAEASNIDSILKSKQMVYDHPPSPEGSSNVFYSVEESEEESTRMPSPT